MFRSSLLCVRFSLLPKLGRRLSKALRCYSFFQGEGGAFPAIWQNHPAFPQNCRERRVGFGLPAQPPSLGFSGSLVFVTRGREEARNCATNWRSFSQFRSKRDRVGGERCGSPGLSLKATFGGHTCRYAELPALGLLEELKRTCCPCLSRQLLTLSGRVKAARPSRALISGRSRLGEQEYDVEQPAP